MMRQILPLVSVLMLPSISLAEIIEYRYQSDNSEKRREAEKHQFINAAGGFAILVSGGLDRKIKLSITKGNTEVYSSTSTRIGIDNRHEDQYGNAYYGAIFNTPNLNDGEYTISETLYSLNDEILNESNVSLVLDTVPPIMSNNIEHAGHYNKTAPDGLPVWSDVEHMFIRITGVDDLLSGIDKITFENKATDGSRKGEVLKSGDVKYFVDEKFAQIGTGGMWTSSHAVQEDYQGTANFTFTAEDKAGNKTSFTQPIYINSKCSSLPKLVAYHDSTFSGTFLGQANMRPVGQDIIIRSNPTRLIFKIPKNQYHRFSEGKIYGGWPVGLNEQYITESGGDAYFAINDIPILMNGLADWPARGWTNSSTWRCHGVGVAYQGYNFSFAADAKAPTTQNIEGYIDGYGWIGINFGFKTSLDVPLDTKISKMRATGEPRGYVQTFSAYGQTCEIPIGLTQCSINVDLDYNKRGTASVHHNWVGLAKKGEPSLYHRLAYIWEWDADSPIFNGGVKHDDRGKTVEFNIISRFSGSTWNRVRLEDAGIIVVSKKANVETRKSGLVMSEGDHSIVIADYADLVSSGEYSIFAYAKDHYGNEMRHLLLDALVDGTPPVISLSVNEQDFEQGQLVLGLESLSFQIDDSSAVSVKHIQLQGGPTSDDVFLAWSRHNSNANTYALEYPRVFPSFNDDELYHLEITAEDYYGNKTTENYKFQYRPNNLFEIESVKTLAINRVLKDNNNKPHIFIKSNQLRSDNGNLAFGPQQVFVTVRSDSPMPLEVNNVVIRPGETKDINVDIGADGRLYLPLIPGESGIEGEAQYMIEIHGIN